MVDDIADCPALRWSDSFGVGVAQLDVEHRALVEQINEICRHSRDGSRAETLLALDALLALATRHLEHEEIVLRDIGGYGALDKHTGEHRNRMTQLAALRERFSEAPPDEASADEARLRNELVDWFVRQSIGHDAAIKGFFDDHGSRFAGRPGRRKASYGCRR